MGVSHRWGVADICTQSIDLLFFNKINELFQLDSTRPGEQAPGCEEEGEVVWCVAGPGVQSSLR